MLLALLLLQAAPQTAVDAERAFYRAAQTKGQWTAFREFAAPDAIIFTPEPARAQEVLPAKNPAVAVQWWPADSYVSCDGALAVNTGPWVRPKGAGFFTTVWQKQADGSWKWLVDGGDVLAKPRSLPETPRVHRAACKGEAPGPNMPFAPDGSQSAQGISPDRTLRWAWHVRKDGSRTFTAELWNGRTNEVVVNDEIAADKS